jgi:hypothetical protein
MTNHQSLESYQVAKGITVKGGVQPSFRFEYMQTVQLKISRFENFLSTYKERIAFTISSYCLHQSEIIYGKYYKGLIVSLDAKIAFVE